MTNHKYIGRVFNADTGECVELLTVMATGFYQAYRIALRNTGPVFSDSGEFVTVILDVKKFHEPGSVKAPQIGV